MEARRAKTGACAKAWFTTAAPRKGHAQNHRRLSIRSNTKEPKGSHSFVIRYIWLRCPEFVCQKYFTFSLKFCFKTSVVIFKNITAVKFVSKTEVQRAAFLAEREFICWRGREHDELYSCQVSNQEDGYISLNLDIMPIRFADAVAEDIARCLYDAVLITVGNMAGFVPTPTMRESAFEIKYRRRISGEWSYCADGKLNCHETKDEIYVVELAGDQCETTESVGVYTVEDGGVELAFDFMGYSFSMLDAVWLANALMEAIGNEPLDLLETATIC